MKDKTNFVKTGFLVALIFSLSITGFAAVNVGDSIYTNLELRTEQFTESYESVIESEEEMNEYFGEYDQEIDFSQEKVAIIALGQRSTGGYSIEITGIEETEDEVILTYEERAPEGMATQALTYPSKVVSVETGERNLVLQQSDSDEVDGSEMDGITDDEESEVVDEEIGEYEGFFGRVFSFFTDLF